MGQNLADISRYDGFEDITMHLKNEKISYVTQWELLPNRQQTYRKDILYVEQLSALLSEKIPSFCNVNLLVVGKGTLPDWLSEQENCNILHLKQELPLRDLIEKLQDIFREKEPKATTESMINALFENSGLEGIAELGEQLMGNPVFIIDTSYRVLAASYRSCHSQEMAERIHSWIQSGWIPEEIIETIKENRSLYKLYEKETPLCINVDTDNPPYQKYVGYNIYGTLIVSIRINHVTVGFLSVAGVNTPFQEKDEDQILYLSRIASIELQKDKSFIFSHGIHYERFLHFLIEGKFKEESLVRQRLGLVEKKLYEDNYFLFITYPENLQDISHAGPRYINQKQLRNFFPGSISCIYEAGCVLFITLPTGKPLLPETTQKDLENYLSLNHLILSISCCFHDIIQAPFYYRQAKEILSLGEKLFPEQCLFQYENLATYQAIEVYAAAGNHLEDLCLPGLIQLKEMDEKQNSNLYETLKLYVLHPDHPREVADQLFIHRNTLLYRVNKAKDLLHIDLSDGETLTRLLLSFKVIEYIDKNKSRLPSS